MATKYPYTAWRLMPSCAVRQVTVVGKGFYSRYERLDNRQSVNRGNLFPTAKLAIHAGKALIETQRARHVKAGENIEKRARALAKAEAEHG